MPWEGLGTESCFPSVDCKSDQSRRESGVAARSLFAMASWLEFEAKVLIEARVRLLPAARIGPKAAVVNVALAMPAFGQQDLRGVLFPCSIAFP